MKNEPEYVAGTLAWCNEIRKTKGKEPLQRLPKGKPMDGHSCPCGKATGVYVGAIGWAETEHDYNYKQHKYVPTCVMDFVAEFDMGRLPQYAE